jgi:DNA mismatch endonuclease (patch repair protein)
MIDYPYPTSSAVTAAMKGNRRADTKPELALRSALHALGYRFRKDHLLRTTDGSRVKADVVFTRDQIAVFVDGCFWHGCPEHGNTPKANTAYWGPKLERNRQRDRRVTRELRADGWLVIRVWEHEALNEAIQRIIEGKSMRSTRHVTANRHDRIDRDNSDHDGA